MNKNPIKPNNKIAGNKTLDIIERGALLKEIQKYKQLGMMKNVKVGLGVVCDLSSGAENSNEDMEKKQRKESFNQ